VGTEPVSPQTAAQLAIRRGSGLTVITVTPESPAAGAGLQRFDVLAKLNDQILVNTEQLASLIRSFEPGDTVTLVFHRGGKEMTATAKLGARTQPVLGPGGRRSNLGFDMKAPAQLFSQRADADVQWQQAREEIAAMGGAAGDEQAARIQLRQERLAAQLQAANERMRAAMGAARSAQASGAAAASDALRRAELLQRELAHAQAASPRAVPNRNETVVWHDGATRIERSSSSGEDVVVITHEGSEIYRGAFPDEAARAALPEEVRSKLIEFNAMALPAPPPTPAPPVGPRGSARVRVKTAPAPTPPPSQ